MVVRVAGFEPTTPWFVAKYSIQLSYTRTVRNHNMPKSYNLGNTSNLIIRSALTAKPSIMAHI